jgi:heptosyltransferase-3
MRPSRPLAIIPKANRVRGVLARNVLIFHSGALGDFVLTWPMTLALARLFPQSRIFYVTQTQKGALAEEVLRVECADVESGWHGLFAEPPQLPGPADALLRGAHTIVNFAADSGGPWETNVRAICPAARLSLPSTKPSDDFAGHMVDFLIEQWRDWPAAHAMAQAILRGINERGISTTAPDSKAILIHPGSGSPLKNWPAERFLELAGQLKRDGLRVRFILGEVELEQWPAEKIALFAEAGELRRPATYVDLLAECSRARLFIGNDSGPAHLAGIIGIPTIALFGPMPPRRWKPLGPKVQAIDGPLEVISVKDVLQAASALKVER